MAVEIRSGAARVAGLLAAGALGGCASEDPLFLVDVAVFAPAVSGDVSLSALNDRVDVDSDLDLGGADYEPLVRAEADFGPLIASASWFRMEQDGTSTLTADFGGISAGSTVASEIDIAVGQGRCVVDLLDTDVAKLGLGVAADWFDLDLESKEATLGTTERVDVEQLVPLLAAHGAVRFDLPLLMPLRLDVNAAAITAHIGDIDGTVVDIEAILRGEAGWLGFFAGYRYIYVSLDGEVSGDPFDGDIYLDGWMAGISVRF